MGYVFQLAQAKRIFSQHARGPACEKYIKQLEEDCVRVWKAGRQLCEAISLTGNPCVNEVGIKSELYMTYHFLPDCTLSLQLHRLLESVEIEEKDLPEKPHCSQLKTKAACNCGRKQAERDDPFTLKVRSYIRS